MTDDERNMYRHEISVIAYEMKLNRYKINNIAAEQKKLKKAKRYFYQKISGKEVDNNADNKL